MGSNHSLGYSKKAKTAEEKYEEFIGEDQPPKMCDIHRFDKLPSHSLFTDAPSPREVRYCNLKKKFIHEFIDSPVQFFMQLSKKAKEKIEERFKNLYEVNKDSNKDKTAGLLEVLSLIETDLKSYMDEAAEKSIQQIDQLNLFKKMMYTTCWFYMDDYLPDLLDWFVKIFNKMLKCLEEHHPVEGLVTEAFLMHFAIMFRVPLALITYMPLFKNMDICDAFKSIGI